MAEVLIRPKNVNDEQWGKAVQLYNVAKNRGDRYPELTVAQAALETGWFKSPAGQYNYFGQKATASQKGSSKSTREASGNSYYRTSARFRDYDTLEEAVDDRVKKWGSKYKNANNIDEAIGSIWRYNPKTGSGEGYATDMNYGSKLKTILGSMGISSSKSNPENYNEPEYNYSNKPVGDYYVDSTINLNQNSGDYLSAPELLETDNYDEDIEGNSAKEELKQAQQEQDFVRELQSRQQEAAQNYNQDQSGYQLYMPELPEYQAPQQTSYFKLGGTMGNVNFDLITKRVKLFEEGGDFADTYLEDISTEDKDKQPTKQDKPKSTVDELISRYASKPGQKVKIDERNLAPKPFTGVREGVNKDYLQKVEKKQIEKKIGTEKELRDQMREAELKNSMDYFSKQLSGKATLEDTIENKDIDLGIGLSNYKTIDQRKNLQKFLIDKGYNLNPEGKFENNGIDGKIGKVTLNAIQDYNRNLSNPSYYSFKEGQGLLGKCTEEQCSEYSQNELFRNIQPNVSRQEWNEKTGIMGDAWNIGRNIIKKGGKEVKPNQVKPGDVITVYTHGISPFQKEADAAGTGTTHVGIVDKVNPDGSYYILHNLHKGSKEEGFEGREYRDLVKAGEIQGHSSPYTVKHIFRPNYSAVESGEKKIVREDLAIKIDPKKAAILDSDTYNNFVASGKKNLENFYIKPLNDAKNKKVLAKVFNLGDDEYSSLAKASLGILGQETKFGSDKYQASGLKTVGAKLSKGLGTLLGEEGSRLVNSNPFGKKIAKRDEISEGAGQLKYSTNFGNDDLTELGITKDNFSNNDKVSLTTMYKLSKDYKKFLEKGFSKKDSLYKAIVSYNSSMGHVVNGKKVEDWAKNYDVDYANKVLNYADMFDVTDNKKSYKTTTDSLLLNKNVAKWRATLKERKAL